MTTTCRGSSLWFAVASTSSFRSPGGGRHSGRRWIQAGVPSPPPLAVTVRGFMKNIRVSHEKNRPAAANEAAGTDVCLCVEFWAPAVASESGHGNNENRPRWRWRARAPAATGACSFNATWCAHPCVAATPVPRPYIGRPKNGFVLWLFIAAQRLWWPAGSAAAEDADTREVQPFASLNRPSRRYSHAKHAGNCARPWPLRAQSGLRQWSGRNGGRGEGEWNECIGQPLPWVLKIETSSHRSSLVHLCAGSRRGKTFHLASCILLPPPFFGIWISWRMRFHLYLSARNWPTRRPMAGS